MGYKIRKRKKRKNNKQIVMKMLSHYDTLELTGYLFIIIIFLQGVGTEDKVLIEILASRTCDEIKEISKAYKKGNIHCAGTGLG